MPVFLAPFVVAGPAVLAALLALGVFMLLRGLASNFKFSLPVIGSVDIGSVFSGAINTVVDWIVGFTKSTWRFVSNWIYGHAYLIEQLAVNTADSILHLGDQIAYIVTHAIPEATLAAEHAVGRAVHSLEETITRDAQKAAVDLSHAIGITDRAIYKAEAVVLRDAEHAIKGAVAAGVDAAVDELTPEITTARDLAKAAEAAAARAAAAADAAADTAAGAVTNIDALRNALFAAMGVSGLLALQNVLSDAISATREFESCGVTNCPTPGKNDLTGLLKTILGLAEFAGVGAFLAELIDNPAAAANAYSGVIAGTYSAGHQALDQLLAL